MQELTISLVEVPEGLVREGSESIRASDDLLMNEAADGKHGKTAVLNFFGPDVIDLCLGLALELAGAIDRKGELTNRARGVLVHVGHAHLAVVVDGFKSTDGDEDLGDRRDTNVEESIDRVRNIVATIRGREVDSLSLKMF